MNRPLLLSGLRELGIEATSAQEKRLELYLEELHRWNRRINLVSAAGDEIIINHLLDSLAGLHRIESFEPSTILDIGSGAGFPGVPLALFLNDTKVDLLERSTKRAAFLESVSALTATGNIEVYPEDLRFHRGKYDVVCMRAFRPLDKVVSEVLSTLSPGGKILCYKGRFETIQEELERTWRILGRELCYEIEEIAVPFLDRKRHLLTVSEVL